MQDPIHTLLAAAGSGKNPPPISTELLKQFEEFGEEMFSELTSVFIEDIGARLTQMQEAVSRHDAHGVAFAAHSIKGVSGNFGAWRLQALAREAEVGAEASDWASLSSLLPHLREATREVELALDRSA